MKKKILSALLILSLSISAQDHAAVDSVKVDTINVDTVNVKNAAHIEKKPVRALQGVGVSLLLLLFISTVCRAGG